MKRISVIIIATVVAGLVHTSSYAASCNCDDWMAKGGYCVDYVKSRIPAFPVPNNKDEMEDLKNKDIPDVTEGDVAIFTISNYWHVAYVEKVHCDQKGEAVAIDVSEMNFGDQLSFAEFKKKWKSNSDTEWQRAVCCGITENYDQASSRKKVALDAVKQIWSPVTAASERTGGRRVKNMVGKVREALNHFLQFTGREL